MTWSKLAHTLLIGLLLGIGFVITPLWWMGLIGVALTVKLLLAGGLTWYQAWLIGTTKSLVFSSWVWRVYPIDWLGIDLGWLELPLIGFYWLTVALSLGAGFIAIALLGNLAVKQLPQWWFYASVPLVWLLSDLLGSFIFSLLLHGPGGSIGVTFSQGYIGYLLSSHALLINIAVLGGVYALNLLYVALGVAALLLWRRPSAVVTVGLLLLATSMVSTQSDNLGPTAKVAIVDTWLPNNVWDTASTSAAWRSELTLAFDEAVANDVDYIIFPEDARFFDRSLDQNLLRATLGFLHHNLDAVVVDSARVDIDGVAYMQATSYDGEVREVYQSQKGYLVPQGEYMPYLYRFLFSLFDDEAVTDTLHNRLPYRVGPNVSQAHYGETVPGVLFCFEVVDARGVRKIVTDRNGELPFIAHIISHGWIHESRVFRQQLETMLRVQAIWNDIAIVTAGNHIPGNLITPTGQVVWGETVAESVDWRVSLVTVPVR